MSEFSRIAAQLPTEREARLDEFGARFAAWRGKRLALFGTGANASDVIGRYADDFDFVPCDSEGGGEVAGRTVISLDEALASGVDAVVIAAKVSSIQAVYDRIASACVQAGVSVLDLYGCDQAELRTTCREHAAAGIDALVDELGGYDVLCLDARLALADAGVRWYDDTPDPLSLEGMLFRLRDAALARDMKVVLINDAAGDCELVRMALAQRGLEGRCALVDAHECGRAKENGLFRVIAQAYPGARILHVGDEEYRDGIVPALFGVEGRWLIDGRGSQQAILVEQTPELPSGLSDAEAALVELVERPAGHLPSNYAVRCYARRALAPLVCAYVQWLARNSVVSDASHVLFAARDGWVIQQVYDRYRAHHPELGLAPSTYLHTSRRAAALPLLNSVDAFVHFTQACTGMTPGEMLERVFDVRSMDAAVSAEDSYEARLAALLANQDAVERSAAEALSSARAYWDRLGLDSTTRCVFSEFVAAGTSQHMLARYAPSPLMGLYVGRRPEVGASDECIEAFFGGQSYLVATFMRHEAFFSSPEPPVDGYTSDGLPVFAEEQRPQRDIEALKAAHEEIVSFAASYFADPRSMHGEVRWEVVDALLRRYDDPDIEMAILDSWTSRAQTEGDGFEASGTRTVRDVLLGLLHEFDDVCARHGLRYCAVHGTLLGAIRDGGFVPWDDDLDVAMPREDFDKLVRLPASEFSSPYFLQTVMNDPGCFFGGYAKLRDSSTTAINPASAHMPHNQGMWMDVLPLDYCSGDKNSVAKQMRRVRHWQRTLYAQTYPSEMNLISDANPKKKSIYYILAGAMSREKLARRLDAACTAHRPSDTLTIFACYYPAWASNRNRFAAKDIEDLERVAFEDTTIPVPRVYESWLKRRYGKEWREAIPTESGRSHDSVIIDPTTPYKETLRRLQEDA